jgi:nicotinamidase-related amidase
MARRQEAIIGLPTVLSTALGLPSDQLATAALITIDVQRDVLDAGPLGVPGTAAVVPRIRRLVEAFRRAGNPIVHIVRLYQADGANAEPCRRELLATATRPILRPNTDGAQPVDGLLPQPAVRLDADLLLSGGIQRVGDREAVIYKPRWGAFYNTPLEAHLRDLSVDTLVFCGANFPNCPRTSIYQASERDYGVLLAADATSGVYPRGIDELAGIGVISLPSETIVNILAARSSQAGQGA